MNSIPDLQEILAKLCPAACEAGRIIMKYYEMDWINSRIKHDGTPVTDADIESEKMIISFLKKISPDIPIISEEQSNVQSRMQEFEDGIGSDTRTFWLVDPLDGTETFMRKKDRFTINIGLVQDTQPVLGVVYFPARDLLYSGISGLSAQIQPNVSRRLKGRPRQIMTSSISKGDITVALIDSRSSGVSNLDSMLRKLKASKRVEDSNIHKLCGVATGEIDVSTIMKSFEWDTAAGHAILKGAGGNLIESNGRELHYGKPEFKNPNLIAHGRVFEESSQ